MRYYEIFEAKAPAQPKSAPLILYHGTMLSNLKAIIEGDTLQVSKNGRDTGVSGVSLTESPLIATQFAHRNSVFSGPVVLALNTSKLISAGYDIQAFAKGYKREKEWRVFGNIHPLAPVLEAVYARLDPRMLNANPQGAAQNLRRNAPRMSKEGKFSIPLDVSLAQADFIDSFLPKFSDLNALLAQQ